VKGVKATKDFQPTISPLPDFRPAAAQIALKAIENPLTLARLYLLADLFSSLALFISRKRSLFLGFPLCVDPGTYLSL
jgi:hypothetical protein